MHIHSHLSAENYIRHVSASTLSAGSYPVYEVRDDLFTDISVDVVDDTLNFFLKLENCLWSVHVDLGLHITP